MNAREPHAAKTASNVEWEAWGQYDPYYGVSSAPGRNRRGATPWTADEFYAVGLEDWALLGHHWEQYGIIRVSCVEIGCGAGRMTRVLASNFDRVHGCDVSKGMILKAQEGLQELKNVTLHLTDGWRLPLPDESVTGAFSTIVFQHFSDESIARHYFAEIYRCLTLGGTMMVNIPLHDYPFTSFVPALRVLYRLGRAFDSGAANLRRLLLRTPLATTRVGLKFGFMMDARSYDYPALYRDLMRIGFRDIEVRAFWVGSERRLHYYVFGRKPAPGLPDASK